MKFIMITISFLSLVSCSTIEKRIPASNEDPKLLSIDFLSPSGDFKANHSSTVTEIPGKKLIGCWYAGAKEGASDVAIYCRKQDLGVTFWSDRIVAVAQNEKTQNNVLKNDTVGNPVLYLDDDQTLYLFYSVRTFGGWTVSEVAYKSSADFGETWSKGTILETRLERKLSGRLTRALPLKLSAGQILLPLYYELSPKSGYTCLLDLKKGKVTKKDCIDIPGNGDLQPTLTQLGTKIYAYLRTWNPDGKIESAVLDMTNGYTKDMHWKKLPNLSLSNPNSSVASTLTSDGKILLVYNVGGRNILNLAISDDGQNFKEIYSFENNTENPNDEFSYPTLIKDSNGIYHLFYTYHGRQAIKHVSFDQSWLNSIQ